MLTTRPNSHNTHIRIVIPRLDFLINSHHPRQHISRLRRNQHLSRTPSRPTSKRHKSPHRPEILPALGLEFLGIGTPDVRVTMEDVLVDLDDIAFADVDGGFTVWSAADG